MGHSSSIDRAVDEGVSWLLLTLTGDVTSALQVEITNPQQTHYVHNFAVWLFKSGSILIHQTLHIICSCSISPDMSTT